MGGRACMASPGAARFFPLSPRAPPEFPRHFRFISAPESTGEKQLQFGRDDNLHMNEPKTKAEFVGLLSEAERALSETREHNPWDLGPSPLLARIRAALQPAAECTHCGKAGNWQPCPSCGEPRCDGCPQATVCRTPAAL
jgi:hypothetical protein